MSSSSSSNDLRNRILFTIGILAGGKATRMGNNDKGLINVGGTPFVEILINKIIPHSKDIIINANRNISQYKKYNYPVVEDEIKGFKGPLSGSCLSPVGKTATISSPLISLIILTVVFCIV